MLNFKDGALDSNTLTIELTNTVIYKISLKLGVTMSEIDLGGVQIKGMKF